MSKAFGQVTSVLGPAERANAQDYRREYTTSFASFTDYLEQLVENKDLDGLYVLFARVDGRFSYLSSELRRKLDGPRTHQQELEIQRILRFVTQLNVAARNLGGDTAINRLFVMRNAIRNMVEDELAQGLQLRAADEAQPEQSAVTDNLLTKQMQAAIKDRRAPTTAILNSYGGWQSFQRIFLGWPLSQQGELFARLLARYYFINRLRAAGTSTPAEDAERDLLVSHLSGLVDAQASLGSVRDAIHTYWTDKYEAADRRYAQTKAGDRQATTPAPATTQENRRQPARGDTMLTQRERDAIDLRRAPIDWIVQAGDRQDANTRLRRLIADTNKQALLARMTGRYLYLDEGNPADQLNEAERRERRLLYALITDWERDDSDWFNSFYPLFRQHYEKEYGHSQTAPAAPRAPAAPPPPAPTTQFRPGEVQGEFLLPGGSTLTAEQRRLRRLQDYADSLTDEKARERADEFLNFYKSIYAPAPTSDRWQEVDNDFVYVATMLCPRPDPLGRFLLCDVMVNPDDENYPYKVQLFLSGTMQKPAGMGISGAKGLLMGSGYSNEALKTINGKKYSRAHTPGGVIVKRVGLGTVLYSAHSLIGAVYRGAAGCYSDGGSASAEAWWREARLRGYAQPSNKFIAKYCAEVKDNRVADGNKTGRIVFPEEICGDVTALPDAYDRWIDYETVLDSGLVVFGVIERGDTFAGSLQFPVKAKHRPFWDTLNVQTGRVNPPGADIFTEWTEDGGSGVYASTGESGLKMALSAETAEMLSRSFHGQSPVLAASIIEALTQSGHDDLAVNYATRADIAPLLAGNPTLKRLLESRSLPGVAGLSNIRYTKLMKAVGLAGLGQATVDMGEKNPLGFKPLSDKTKRMLAKFKDMD